MAKSSHRHNSNPDSDSQTDPLQTQKPHELIPFLELETFSESPSRDINQVPSPRVFNTHLPYSILPEAVKNSGRRIIYISRNPADNTVSTWHFYNKRFGTKITLEVAFDEFCQGTVGLGPADTFVSTWHFYNKRFGTKIPLEVAFDEFCQGTVGLGPFVDRVFEYWLEIEKENVLFVTYEELKDDPNKHVSRIAEFLGCSLGADEIDQVVWKCSHERLSQLDVNKDKERVHWSGMKFSSYFRRGVVGDGKKHLSPEMMERIETLANQRWEGSGLEIKMFGAEPNPVKPLGII